MFPVSSCLPQQEQPRRTHAQALVREAVPLHRVWQGVQVKDSAALAHPQSQGRQDLQVHQVHMPSLLSSLSYYWSGVSGSHRLLSSVPMSLQPISSCLFLLTLGLPSNTWTCHYHLV